MYLKSVLQMGSLILHFRNGRTLVERMRAGLPCDEVVLWNGTRIAHPPGRGGLLETVVELWLERSYTEGFYRPADGDVIVDAGANVGMFAIYMGRQNRRCRVVALEPFSENFQYLLANVARGVSGNRDLLRNGSGSRVRQGTHASRGNSVPRSCVAGRLEPADGIAVIPLPDCSIWFVLKKSISSRWISRVRNTTFLRPLRRSCSPASSASRWSITIKSSPAH